MTHLFIMTESYKNENENHLVWKMGKTFVHFCYFEKKVFFAIAKPPKQQHCKISFWKLSMKFFSFEFWASVLYKHWKWISNNIPLVAAVVWGKY